MPPKHRIATILGLALPIIGGMMSQNILNLVDTAMVGRLGNEALAATGLGGFAFFMAIATMMGLSAAVQAMAARRVGEGKLNHAAQPLNSALLLALVFGVPFSVLLIFTAPHFFPILNGDAAVSSQGIPYLQARFSTLALGGMTFAFRGYFNGVDRPIVYMRTLLITHAVNIVLNFAFALFSASSRVLYVPRTFNPRIFVLNSFCSSKSF